jgi:hypothetical protein
MERMSDCTMTERAAHIAAPRATSLGLVNVAAWQLGIGGSYAFTPASHTFVDVPKHRTRRLLEPSP